MIIGNKPGRWVYYAPWADTIRPFAQLDGPERQSLELIKKPELLRRVGRD